MWFSSINSPTKSHIRRNLNSSSGNGRLFPIDVGLSIYRMMNRCTIVAVSRTSMHAIHWGPWYANMPSGLLLPHLTYSSTCWHLCDVTHLDDAWCWFCRLQEASQRDRLETGAGTYRALFRRKGKRGSRYTRILQAVARCFACRWSSWWSWSRWSLEAVLGWALWHQPYHRVSLLGSFLGCLI